MWLTLERGPAGSLFAPGVSEVAAEFMLSNQPRLLKYISARAEKLSNVRTVLGKEDDPFLPQQSVDAVLILKTYHEIAQPVRLLKHLRQSMGAARHH